MPMSFSQVEVSGRHRPSPETRRARARSTENTRHRVRGAFWDTEGDIFVICRNVEFRMHHKILEGMAPKLGEVARMLGEEAAAAPDNTVKYHLDDFPEDFTFFMGAYLETLHDNDTPIISDDASFDELAGIVRLSMKYNATEMCQRAIDWLKYHFTDDFAVYDQRNYYVPPGFKLWHAIGVINLARMTNTHSIIPTAILACCNLPRDALPRRFKSRDGKKITLEIDDFVRIRLANEKLILLTQTVAELVYEPTTSSDCSTKEVGTCVRGLTVLRRDMQDKTDRFVSADPFQRWAPRARRLPRELKLCDACIKMLKHRDAVIRKHAWSKLPCMIDDVIGGWPGGNCPKHSPANGDPRSRTPGSETCSLERERGSED